MKTFKTQQEIWAHLVNGGKVINDDGGIVFFQSDGRLNDSWTFAYSENWSIYEEPKPKTVLHEYLIQISMAGGFYVEFHKDDESFKRRYPYEPIIKTGRTIEVEVRNDIRG